VYLRTATSGDCGTPSVMTRKRDIQIPSSTQSLKVLQSKTFFICVAVQTCLQTAIQIKKAVSVTLSNFGSVPAASGRDGRNGASTACAVANPIFRLRAKGFQTLEVSPRRAVGMGVTEQAPLAQ